MKTLVPAVALLATSLAAQWDGEPLTATRLEQYLAMAENSGTPVAVFTGVAPPGTAKQFPRYRTQLGRPAEVEDAPFLSPSDRADIFFANAERFLNLGSANTAR